MILFENGLIKLDYDPATDILFLDWPSLQAYAINEMRHSLEKLVEIVRNYDIKLVLVDSSRSVVDVNDAEYKAVMTNFVYNIMQTRLQKMARVMTPNSLRERKINEIEAETKPTIQFANFPDKASAKEWLLSA